MNEFQPVNFGKYTLLKRISVGPIAEFYRASTPDGQGDWCTFFIKKLLPHVTKNQNLLDAFSSTARISSLLEHKNIARVFDFGKENGTFYLASEYLDGHPLHDIMAAATEQGRTIGLENALFIAIEICRGLAYAHTFEDPSGIVSRVIHGNLSPQTIFVTSDGQVKLTDFGMHTENGQDRATQLDMIKGKLAYMSPEQVGGDAIEKRTDIFSLGTLLYEMVTGKKTFQGETMEVFSMVRQARFEPPEKIAEGLPPKVCEIIHRSLEKAPSERYPSAGAMQEDLQKALTAAPAQSSENTLSQCLTTLFTCKTQNGKQGHPPRPTPAAHSEKPVLPGSTTRKNRPQPKCQNPVNVKPPASKIDREKTGSISRRQTRGPRPGGLKQRHASKPWPKKIHWFLSAPAALVLSLFLLLAFTGDPKTNTHEPNNDPVIEMAVKALDAGRFEQAVLRFEQALAADPVTIGHISRSYARALDGHAAKLLESDPQKAEELLLTARQFDPKSVQACARLGLVYLNLKKYEKAIATYEEAVKLDPQLADAFFNLGYVYAVNKDYMKAQEMYSEAVELSPPFLDEALFNLAVVQAQVGDRRESIKNLRRAIDINPKNKQAKQYLQTLTS